MEKKDGAMEGRKAGVGPEKVVLRASDPGCGEESSRARYVWGLEIALS